MTFADQDENENEEAQDETANEEDQDVTANEEAQDENANEEAQDETGSEADGECCGDEECDSDKAVEAAESCGDDADATTDADAPVDAPVDATAGDFPVASLEMLLMTHHTQAVMALGMMPDPMTGETSANKDAAKFHIDMLSIIEEKTKGNLTDEESEALNSILHQLRMAFFAS